MQNPRRCQRKTTGVTCLGLALATLFGALVSCGGEDDPPPIRHPSRMTVWAEFMEPGDLQEWFGFAGASELNVNVAINQDEHDRAWLGEVCQVAEEHDIALRIA